jgi:phage/plasmid-associated DNA primase
MKKRQDEQREINKGIREKREAHIAELYDTLKNKSGKHTVEEIENAKTEIKNLMMPAFWDIEGMNVKTGNPGHLSLKKLPIADYINKAFNIVKFGGRNWWYDWSKAFYTYDSDDVYIQKEVCDIMDAVGDGDFYKYNGNIISDKSQIIDKASNVKVYTDNPFNKHTGYINTKNGVLHIDYKNRKVSLIGKKPEYMFSYCIDTEFHPEKVDTEIHRVLGENLGELQRDLIYQMAAIAIRDTDPKLIPSKIAYLFIGPRNTGKNVVMQILNDFFGSAIVSRIPLNEIAEKKFVKPLLEGKVINLDDELPEHLPLTESREIKSLTGGKFHTLEPKNVKPYSGVITALLVFAGNQFPKCSISKNDTAFWDRWEIITFDKEQHKVDEDFLTNLLTPDNLSGFFNRVIDKLFEIHGQPIIRKKDLGIFETYNEWMYSSSTVYRFFQDMMVNSDDRMEYSKEEFFKYYHEWCEAMSIPRENRATTLQEFGRELSQTCHVKEGRIGTDERHYVYRMFKRYEPDQLAVCLGAASESNEPEMYVVQPDLEEPDIPEEVCYVDEDGFLVREYVYKK